MHTSATELFEQLWQNYLQVTPSATAIHQLLGEANGKDVINDHIALRTFNVDKVNKEKLAAHFEAVGYKQCGEYDFEAKKLKAKHYEHANPEMPKVFISELLVEEFSEPVQTIINNMLESLDESALTSDNFLYSGTHWQVSQQDYQTLLAESEYAAWMAAWGYRANHFTVNINLLTQFDTIEQVNQALKDAGFVLNSAGGEIKGSPGVLLEQSSTMADKAPVEFTDGTIEIPSCFYEFAIRYPMPNGELYTGFVAASADKIFESTNTNG
jgi:hypothetical protein